MKIQSLKPLHTSYKVGLLKKWLYDSKITYNFACDCLQKINYSIQDINNELASINDINQISTKSIVYIITLVDWIRESTILLETIINKEIIKKFKYDSNKSYMKYNSYFKALRSFINAHPYETNRHASMGLDGKYICVDIRNRSNPSYNMFEKKDIYYFGIDGIKQDDKDCDYYLLSYTEDRNFYVRIGCDLSDILDFANLCVDKICKLDSYLYNLKRRDYIHD